jgi:S-formylglutathione hydrolase FrmB
LRIGKSAHQIAPPWEGQIMKRLMRILAAGLMGLGSVSAAQAAGTVEFGLMAESPVLGRPIPYAVYKPFPFPAEGERWPVVYLLHGLGGADGDWFTWGNLGPILDRAIGEGRIKPMVVVAPGAGDSWYVDNPDPGSLGNVATAFTSDLIAAIDKSLPTAACKEGRAIGGLSMGGVGAVMLAIQHPDLYTAAISLSGALQQPIAKGDPREFWNMEELYKGSFGRPFDRERYNKASVFGMMGKLHRTKEKPAFWIFDGEDDWPDLIEGAAHLHNELKKAGAETHLRMGPGRHYWETWQQSIVPALEWVSPKLQSGC